MAPPLRSNEEIKRDVEEELQWDPDLDSADIAVAVKDGIVTLTGFAHSYSQKVQAGQDAKRVPGVLAIVNDIEVRLPLVHRRPDPEIARDVVAALQNELPFSFEKIKAVVEDGRVRLEGEVDWSYVRIRAEEAVRRIRGVKGVQNLLTVKPQAIPVEIKQKIEAAFVRNAEIDADSIKVETSGDGTVILKGTVRSWAEREEAERVAWSAPGVRKVENRIEVAT